MSLLLIVLLIAVAGLVGAFVAAAGYVSKNAVQLKIGLAVLIIILLGTLAFLAFYALIVFGCHLPDCHAP